MKFRFKWQGSGNQIDYAINCLPVFANGYRCLHNGYGSVYKSLGESWQHWITNAMLSFKQHLQMYPLAKATSATNIKHHQKCMRNLNQSVCVYLRNCWNLSSLTNWITIPTTIRSSRQWNFRWQQLLDISFQLFQLWGWMEPAITLVGSNQKRIGKIRKDRRLSLEHLPKIKKIIKLRILFCFLLGFQIILFLQSIPRIAGNSNIFGLRDRADRKFVKILWRKSIIVNVNVSCHYKCT